MRRALMIAVLAALAAAPSAVAAEPESATVSASSPAATWTGTLVRPYLHHNVYNYEPPGTVPCTSPACDTFTLEVADSADLVITVASEQTNDMSMRIQHPDGTWEYYAGWADAAKPTKATIRKAPTGTYTINVVARVFGSTNPTAVDDTADYTGTAELKVPSPPAPVVPAAPAVPAQPAAPAPEKQKASRRAACRKKAKRIRKAKKRKAALRRCAKRRR